MSGFAVQATNGKLDWTFDFSNEMQDGESLSSIVITAPDEVTLSDQSDSLASYLKTVLLSGVPHAGLYVIEAVATKNTGVKVSQSLVVRGWYGK